MKWQKTAELMTEQSWWADFYRDNPVRLICDHNDPGKPVYPDLTDGATSGMLLYGFAEQMEMSVIEAIRCVLGWISKGTAPSDHWGHAVATVWATSALAAEAMAQIYEDQDQSHER